MKNKSKNLYNKIYKLYKNLKLNWINTFSRKYSKYLINKTRIRIKKMIKF